MNPKRIEYIRGYFKKAHPGPWEGKCKTSGDWAVTINDATGKTIAVFADVDPSGHNSDQECASASLMTLGRNELPALLDEIEALRAERDQLRSEIERLRAGIEALMGDKIDWVFDQDSGERDFLKVREYLQRLLDGEPK